MNTTSTASPATSKRLGAMLDTLLNISTALGTLREHQRLHEIRLTSMEARFDTLTVTLMRSAPRPCTPPTKTTPITPPSTITSRSLDTRSSKPMEVSEHADPLSKTLTRTAQVINLLAAAAKLAPHILVALVMAWKWAWPMLRSALGG